MDDQILAQHLKVCILPSNNGNNLNQSKFITLPNCKTWKPVQFMIESVENKSFLYEVNKYEDKHSSWFIGNQIVKSDGTLYLVTKFDPLFIIIGYFQQVKSDQYHVLNQVITTDHFDDIINCLSNINQLEKICDVNKIGSLTSYKFNEAKTLEWLIAKVKRIEIVLQKCNKIYLPPLTGKDTAKSESEDRKIYSWKLISNYLNKSFEEKLGKALNINLKRKLSNSDLIVNSKKAKILVNEDYSENITSDKKDQKSSKSLTKTEKALKKIDKSGMKKISSFFQKK